MTPVDDHLDLSAPPRSMSSKDTTKRVDPWITGAGTPTRGLADQKDTTDSMDTIEPNLAARPAHCPTCGHVPTHSDVRFHEGVATGHYVCAFDHPWIVRWMGGMP